MNRFFLFPLNIAVMLAVSTLLAVLNLSVFFNKVYISDILLITTMMIGYLTLYFLIKKRLNLGRPDLYQIDRNIYSYRKFVYISTIIFVIQFGLYGIPALSYGGRDELKVLPVFHVIAYSCVLVAVLLSSLYSTKRNKVIVMIFATVLSILLLSRQLILVSFLVFVISILVQKDLSRKVYFKLFLVSIFIIIFFGVVGNFRQQLAGDYTTDYILIVGGANEKGEKIGDILYWLWLYLASPIYNLIVNFDSYEESRNFCNNAVYYGSCDGNFIISVLTPDTFVKYLGFDEFLIDLEISYLNVGTGFAKAARILGIFGVLVQIIFHGVAFYIGSRIFSSKLRLAFIVYFSTLSIFMVFDNLYIRGEFFFVFIILFMCKYSLKSNRKAIS